MPSLDPRTGGGSTPRRYGVGKRSWTAVAGILPIVASCTIVAACAVAILPVGREWNTVMVVAVILLGLGAGLVWSTRGRAEAVHGRVAAARAQWAVTWPDAVVETDAAADPRDTALALPRSWRVESVRGRVRFSVSGFPVRAATWVLERGPGAKRSPRRREVVAVDALTGAARLWMPLGAAVDPLLVMPSWRDRVSDEPAWSRAVRDRAAAHEDVVASLAIGDDRVILFALDDPRPETMLRRAELVRDVAAIIEAEHGCP